MSDNESKENLIINKAQELFTKFGYHKTTIDNIADACRVGKASLYHYFKNKEDIFRVVVNKEENILNEKLKEASNRAKTPKEKMKAFILTRTVMLSKLLNIYNALKDRCLDYIPFIERKREKYFKDELAFISRVLKDGVKKNILNIKNITKTSIAILTALKGFDVQLLEKKDFEESLNILVDIFFEGMSKRRTV